MRCSRQWRERVIHCDLHTHVGIDCDAVAVALGIPLGQQLQACFDTQLAALDMLAIGLPSSILLAMPLHPVIAAIVGNLDYIIGYRIVAHVFRAREASSKVRVRVFPIVECLPNNANIGADLRERFTLRYALYDLLRFCLIEHWRNVASCAGVVKRHALPDSRVFYSVSREA